MFPLNRFAKLLVALVLIALAIIAHLPGFDVMLAAHPAALILAPTLTLSFAALLVLDSLRPVYRRRVLRWAFAATGLAAVMAMSACAGLPLTGNPAADAKTAAANVSAINANLGAFNQQAMTAVLLACGTDVDVSVAFPAPVPSGKLDFKCHIAPGQLSIVNGQIVTTPAAPLPAMPAPTNPAPAQ
jgi:hypothetical protein